MGGIDWGLVLSDEDHEFINHLQAQTAQMFPDVEPPENERAAAEQAKEREAIRKMLFNQTPARSPGSAARGRPPNQSLYRRHAEPNAETMDVGSGPNDSRSGRPGRIGMRDTTTAPRMTTGQPASDPHQLSSPRQTTHPSQYEPFPDRNNYSRPSLSASQNRLSRADPIHAQPTDAQPGPKRRSDAISGPSRSVPVRAPTPPHLEEHMQNARAGSSLLKRRHNYDDTSPPRSRPAPKQTARKVVAPLARTIYAARKHSVHEEVGESEDESDPESLSPGNVQERPGDLPVPEPSPSDELMDAFGRGTLYTLAWSLPFLSRTLTRKWPTVAPAFPNRQVAPQADKLLARMVREESNILTSRRNRVLSVNLASMSFDTTIKQTIKDLGIETCRCKIYLRHHTATVHLATKRITLLFNGSSTFPNNQFDVSAVRLRSLYRAQAASSNHSRDMSLMVQLDRFYGENRHCTDGIGGAVRLLATYDVVSANGQLCESGQKLMPFSLLKVDRAGAYIAINIQPHFCVEALVSWSFQTEQNISSLDIPLKPSPTPAHQLSIAVCYYNGTEGTETLQHSWSCPLCLEFGSTSQFDIAALQLHVDYAHPEIDMSIRPLDDGTWFINLGNFDEHEAFTPPRPSSPESSEAEGELSPSPMRSDADGDLDEPSALDARRRQRLEEAGLMPWQRLTSHIADPLKGLGELVSDSWGCQAPEIIYSEQALLSAEVIGRPEDRVMACLWLRWVSTKRHRYGVSLSKSGYHFVRRNWRAIYMGVGYAGLLAWIKRHRRELSVSEAVNILFLYQQKLKKHALVL